MGKNTNARSNDTQTKQNKTKHNSIWHLQSEDFLNSPPHAPQRPAVSGPRLRAICGMDQTALSGSDHTPKTLCQATSPESSQVTTAGTVLVSLLTQRPSPPTVKLS